MIVAKCPVRVSLVGGSSDLQSFLEVHGRGAVISLPCSLYTYIGIHENHRGRYIIDYSSHEEADKVSQIKNDIVREVFDRFEPKNYLTVSFNSDIFSVGSGLAASSSYVITMIKAMTTYLGLHMAEFDICKLALELERKFNPLTGQQDPYGCGMPGFKKISFHHEDDPTFEYLDSSFLDQFDVYMLYTGIVRNSTNVLKSIPVNKSKSILSLVDVMHQAIIDKDSDMFLEIINEGWQKKKTTSRLIMANDKLIEIDSMLSRNEQVLAHKLCGAGGGGHFVVFTSKGSSLGASSVFGKLSQRLTKVMLSASGIQSRVI